MYDFIKSLNLADELKNNDLYNIFKTDSSELNLHFLSTLQKFHTTQDFLNYYTQQDCNKVFNMYNTLSSISSKIYNENFTKGSELSCPNASIPWYLSLVP